MKHTCKIILALVACVISTSASAEGKEEYLPYGNMNSWTIRHIKESGVIGGDTKTLYEVGPNRTITGNKPYVNGGGSPWGTSNVMAKVMGVVKTNNSVYRDKHGSGYCAKLETHIEKVRVLGPKALRFDYMFKAAGTANRVKQNGFSSGKTVAGKDYATCVLFLQKRTEDAKGNITAKRVGTMVVRYGKSTGGWVSGATYEILYGDIRNNPHYNAATMGLRSTDYARNSKGKSVLVKETGWASADETPTHLMLQFSSSHGGAYIGSPGNTLWVDNVRLVY